MTAAYKLQYMSAFKHNLIIILLFNNLLSPLLTTPTTPNTLGFYIPAHMHKCVCLSPLALAAL